jgi:hypothetical protein
LTSVTAAIVVPSLDVFISSWHFPFRSPRHVRGLLMDAIIPLSVAVAKVKAAINPLKMLIGWRP